MDSAVTQNKSLRKTVQTLFHTQRIKRLIRDQLCNGAQCLISVRETECLDPACEGLATEIRVTFLDFRVIKVVVHKPLQDVVAADVATLA